MDMDLIMIRINCVVLGFSLASCALTAMDCNGLTMEQKLRLSRMIESHMSPTQELKLWQQNNMQELEIERQRNTRELEAQYHLNVALAELESRLRLQLFDKLEQNQKIAKR